VRASTFLVTSSLKITRFDTHNNNCCCTKVWSAYSSGFFAFATCAVTREPGHPASRAAPALAGAAALLREFISDDGPNGLFAKQSPVGYAASSYSATAPSAALVKVRASSDESFLVFIISFCSIRQTLLFFCAQHFLFCI